MEQTNVVGEVKPEKKVAFTNRKYTNEERQKKDEEELAQLVEENKTKPEEVEVEESRDYPKKSFEILMEILPSKIFNLDRP